MKVRPLVLLAGTVYFSAPIAGVRKSKAAATAVRPDVAAGGIDQHGGDRDPGHEAAVAGVAHGDLQMQILVVAGPTASGGRYCHCSVSA